MKRILSIVICIIMLVTSLPLTATVTASGSSIIIQTADDLSSIRNNLSGNYILANNIDLSSYGNWSPIGSLDNPFTGVLDGNGCEIKNMTIHQNHDLSKGDTVTNAALFVAVSGGTIRNLGIVNASVSYNLVGSQTTTTSYCNASGFAGEITNGGLIEKCYFTGDISSETSYNSFARSSAFGCCDNATIRNCFANATISAKADFANTMAGGIAAWNASSTIDKCYAAGTIYAQNTKSYVYAGGIVGSGNGTVSNCAALQSSLSFDGLGEISGRKSTDVICAFSTLSNNVAFSDLFSSFSNRAATGISMELATTDSTYKNIGWDFSSTWEMGETYPVLKASRSEYHIVGRKFDTNLDYYTAYWNSSSYNAHLANMLAALSAAVYSEADINNACESLGFTDYGVYDYDGSFNAGRCGYAMAFKKSDYSNDTICLISVRGSSNVSDWVGNIALATFENEKHIGFAYPANSIYDNIQSSLPDSYKNSNIKYVITGHSRGAAVANLLAVKLMEKGVAASDVYNYNFACPDVACKIIFPGYNNIFNLCNREDPVPFVPGTLASVFTQNGFSWGKFGRTYWFTKDDPDTLSPFADHSIWLYLDFFDQKLNPSDWGVSIADRLDDASHWIRGWITKIMCPVDVRITDANGNTIASVINGEINYYDSSFGDIIILTDGDKKVIYINGEKNFNVHLIGTDSGEMTYSIEEYNLLTDEVLESKVFTGVQLETGKTMYSPVSSAATTGDVELFVMKNQSGHDIATHTVDTDGDEKEIVYQCEHSYTTEIVDSTCTEKGYTIHTCSICGETFNDSYIDITDHVDSDKDGHCDVCGATTSSQDPAANCSCKCHKTGFFAFLWKIINFLRHFFGMEQYRSCDCGVLHW